MTNMTGCNETAYIGCEAIPDAPTPLKFRHLPETKKRVSKCLPRSVNITFIDFVFNMATCSALP